MKPGLVSITFRALQPEAIIRLVAEAGLGGIEWGGDVHVPHGDVQRAEVIGRMTRDAGLAVASYGSYYNFADCDPETREPGPSIEAVLETAEALGAPAVRIWAGSRSPAETPLLVRQRIVERAWEIAEEAAKRGLRVDFEFHENSLTETAASTVRLLEEVDHRTVSTLWQPPLQMVPEERLAGLCQVRPWVTNVHCNHFGQDPWPRVHALDKGAAEWKSYLAALANEAKERWVLIEHVRDHAVDAFREDAATLRRWLESA